jgi:hypothetical protein
LEKTSEKSTVLGKDVCFVATVHSTVQWQLECEFTRALLISCYIHIHIADLTLFLRVQCLLTIKQSAARIWENGLVASAGKRRMERYYHLEKLSSEVLD